MSEPFDELIVSIYSALERIPQVRGRSINVTHVRNRDDEDVIELYDCDTERRGEYAVTMPARDIVLHFLEDETLI